MNPLLIVDTETTGLSPETDDLVEVGAIVFDPNLGIPVSVRSNLIAGKGNAAEAINRIPASALGESYALSRADVVEPMLELVNTVGMILVAQNAAFDRSFLPEFESHRWICTKRDVEWDRLPTGTGSLVQIALAYDVGVVRAHRAIEDCLTLAAILSKVHALEGGLEGWIERALEPRVEVRARVSYSERQRAKDYGFTWDPERKIWTKRVRESRVDAYRGEVTFAFEVLK